MKKPEKFTVFFSAAILLDSAERGLRAIVFAMVLIAFFNQIDGARPLFGTAYLSSSILLFSAAIAWGLVSFLLHKIFIYGAPNFDNWCKKFLKRKTGRSVGFRSFVYVSSSLVQFVGVLILSILLMEYIFFTILSFLTITIYGFLYLFPRVINFLYALSVGQSQLLYMILAVTLIFAGDYFGFYSLSIKTAVLILALRLSLLYFVRFIVLSTLATTKKSKAA